MKLKFAAKISAAIFAVLLSVLALFLFVNRRDEPPSEAVLQLQAALAARPAVAPEDNAYVHLLALAVPPEMDAVAIGKARYDWLVQQSAHDGVAPDTFQDRLKKVSTVPGAEFTALYGACEEVDRTCAAALQRDPVLAASWLRSQGWLLARYRALAQATGYRDIAELTSEMPFPDYATLKEGQRLHVIDAWLSVRSGKTDKAAAMLALDIRFWRRMQASTSTFIAKMMAGAGMKRHFAWASPVLSAAPAGGQLALVPASWRDSLSLEERDVLLSMAGEYHFIRHSIWQIGNDSDEPVAARFILASGAIQPQATVNRLADQMVRVAASLRVDYAQLPKAAERHVALDKPGMVEILYNPLGRIMLSEPSAMVRYGQRVADLEAMRRAALLAAELRNEGVTEAMLPERLSNAALRSPYTSKPFAWDAKQRALVVGELQKSGKGPLMVPY